MRTPEQAKILVVDDEQRTLDLLGNVLGREGYEIRTSRELRYLREGLRAKYRLENIVGTSPANLEIPREVNRNRQRSLRVEHARGSSQRVVAQPIRGD